MATAVARPGPIVPDNSTEAQLTAQLRADPSFKPPDGYVVVTVPPTTSSHGSTYVNPNAGQHVVKEQGWLTRNQWAIPLIATGLALGGVGAAGALGGAGTVMGTGLGTGSMLADAGVTGAELGGGAGTALTAGGAATYGYGAGAGATGATSLFKSLITQNLFNLGGSLLDNYLSGRAANNLQDKQGASALQIAQLQAEAARQIAQIQADTQRQALGVAGNIFSGQQQYFNGAQRTAAANVAPYTKLGSGAASTLGRLMGIGNVGQAAQAPPPMTGGPMLSPMTQGSPIASMPGAGTPTITPPVRVGQPVGQTVRMRAPTGEVQDVPAAQVAHFLTLGAVRV